SGAPRAMALEALHERRCAVADRRAAAGRRRAQGQTRRAVTACGICRRPADVLAGARGQDTRTVSTTRAAARPLALWGQDLAPARRRRWLARVLKTSPGFGWSAGVSRIEKP